MVEIKTQYINLQTDFGFKRVFGEEKNKKALIRFLNILFEGKLTVTDVVYHDKEILPTEPAGKRIVYDVYCTSLQSSSDSKFFSGFDKIREADNQHSHHFILEMQNLYNPPFEERIVFYATKAIAGQGKAGWDYFLDPVFAIAITDFNFPHLKPKLLRDVALMDRESGEILTDKLHILLCSLKEVPESWENCKTELEQILFLIKNMENMNNASLAYQEGNFTEIFDAARSSHLKKDDIILYSQSLEAFRETQRGIQYAADRAREQGRMEGRMEGREEERRRIIGIALKAKKKGIYSIDQISDLTGLSVDFIESL